MDNLIFETPNPNPVTEAEIAALEERCHFRMPEDMRAFYLAQNGGAVAYCSKVDTDVRCCPLRDFTPIAHSWAEYALTMNTLLEWQERDGFIPMNYIPLCADIADDFFYIRVDEEGYGKVYYIFSEDLDEFLENPEDSLAAGSFTEFLERIAFVGDEDEEED